MKPIERLKEPSTWAGFGLIFQAILLLLASKGMDGTAWGTLAAGVAAVVMPESGKTPAASATPPAAGPEWGNPG